MTLSKYWAVVRDGFVDISTDSWSVVSDRVAQLNAEDATPADVSVHCVDEPLASGSMWLPRRGSDGMGLPVPVKAAKPCFFRSEGRLFYLGADGNATSLDGGPDEPTHTEPFWKGDEDTIIPIPAPGGLPHPSALDVLRAVAAPGVPIPTRGVRFLQRLWASGDRFDYPDDGSMSHEARRGAFYATLRAWVHGFESAGGDPYKHWAIQGYPSGKVFSVPPARMQWYYHVKLKTGEYETTSFEDFGEAKAAAAGEDYDGNVYLGRRVCMEDIAEVLSGDELAERDFVSSLRSSLHSALMKYRVKGATVEFSDLSPAEIHTPKGGLLGMLAKVILDGYVKLEARLVEDEPITEPFTLQTERWEGDEPTGVDRNGPIVGLEETPGGWTVNTPGERFGFDDREEAAIFSAGYRAGLTERAAETHATGSVVHPQAVPMENAERAFNAIEIAVLRQIRRFEKAIGRVSGQRNEEFLAIMHTLKSTVDIARKDATGSPSWRDRLAPAEREGVTK